jgi:serine/threonine protein kinase
MDDDVPLIVNEPKQIGPFTMLGTIGEGAFSLVKLVRHEVTGRFYAAKIVPRSRLCTDYLRQRFEIEIRTHQVMHHPGIVQLHDLYKDDNNFYVILEFCANGELFQYIVDQGRLSEQEARVLTVQMLQALKYVQSQGVTHRDLKPENIFLTELGHAKLGDFGLSRFMPPDNLVGTPCGSPCYASPECLSGEPYDSKTTDLWSLGVIVFAMVTGELPWTKRDQNELFDQIRRGEYTIPNFISDDCAWFLQGLMTVSTDDRLTVESALAHPWVLGTRWFVATSWVPAYISLKQVDLYFEVDSSDPIVGDEGLRRCTSATPVSLQGAVGGTGGRSPAKSELPALNTGVKLPGIGRGSGTTSTAIALGRRRGGITTPKMATPQAQKQAPKPLTKLPKLAG